MKNFGSAFSGVSVIYMVYFVLCDVKDNSILQQSSHDEKWHGEIRKYAYAKLNLNDIFTETKGKYVFPFQNVTPFCESCLKELFIYCLLSAHIFNAQFFLHKTNNKNFITKWEFLYNIQYKVVFIVHLNIKFSNIPKSKFSVSHISSDHLVQVSTQV